MKAVETVTDIDIDVGDRDEILGYFRHEVAAIDRDNRLVKHNTGVYFHYVPADPVRNRCVFDHKKCEQMGFFKIDILNLNLYSDIKNENHLNRLLAMEPHWELLESEEVCQQLHHVSNYSHILQELKPRSVIELAMVLALIRPGKKHLYTDAVKHGLKNLGNEIWQLESDEPGYSFKKSHAVAYATAIVVQLNRLVEKTIESS